MVRGEVNKRSSKNIVELERRILTKTHLLKLDRSLCLGCGICVDTCPKEAVKESPPSLQNGRLIEKRRIDLDGDLCTFCGICVVLCPSNALRMWVDAKEGVPVVENKAFPTLLKKMQVTREKCDISCNLKCQEVCPTRAIKVLTADSKPEKIVDVKVDLGLCIYCRRCEVCPRDAIDVEMPMHGSVELKTQLCPDGCMACVDICPSKALELDHSAKPQLLEKFCFYCGACRSVCPADAIKVRREHVAHTDAKSAAWFIALGKLTSAERLASELAYRSDGRMRELAKKSLLL